MQYEESQSLSSLEIQIEKKEKEGLARREDRPGHQEEKTAEEKAWQEGAAEILRDSS